MLPKRQKKHHHSKNQPEVLPGFTDFSDDLQNTVRKHFQKKFTYQPPESSTWLLPKLENWFTEKTQWQDGLLQDYKHRLNAVKSRLSDHEISEWHEHTNTTNVSGKVVSHARRAYHVELGTQAWCKSHEIYHQFNLIGPECSVLNTLHLCEAPGAFITSFNHYLKTQRPYVTWNWLANTLNPYYEGNIPGHMINDDRFILDTLAHWDYGVDNTGDIMLINNIMSLKSKAEQLGPVLLVTADGSIDCQDDPGEQERTVSSLHYCEVVAALAVLNEGGSLVKKMFTLFENLSVCLMYLLNCCFAEVHTCKPGTSKGGNSEVYVVCCGYKGLSGDQLETLMSQIDRQDPASELLFRLEDLPDSFLQQHRECCQYFMQQQINVIERNIGLFQNMTPEVKQMLLDTQNCGVSYYQETYHLTSLSHDQRIVPYHKRPSGKPPSHSSFGRRRHKGSFTQRQHLAGLPWKQRVQDMELYEVSEMSKISLHEVSTEWRVSVEEFDKHLVIGHQFNEVHSSRFIEHETLQEYKDVLAHTQFQGHMVTDSSRLQILWNEVFQYLTPPGSAPAEVKIVSTTEECLPTASSLVGAGHLTQWLKEQGVQAEVVSLQDISKCSNSAVEGATIRMFHVPLPHDIGSACMNTYQHIPLLETLLPVLQNLECGDHLVMDTFGWLTRFQAGLLYCLLSLFQWAVLVHDGAGPTDAGQVVLLHYHGDQLGVINFLKGVLEKASTLSQQGGPMAVLQFVPVYRLYDNAFFQLVTGWNDQLLKTRINRILQLEKGLGLT